MSDDLLTSITKRDVIGFRETLDSGWRPPKVTARYAGTIDDYSVCNEIILRDWVDGLSMLYDKYPELVLSEGNWGVALRGGSAKCAAFLWDKMNRSQNIHLKSERDDLIRFSISSLGESWSPLHEKRDSYDLVLFFMSIGLDVNALVFPGEYTQGDLRSSGHSLWTKCAFMKELKYVNLLWPKNIQEWSTWERFDEILLHLINVVVGDYIILLYKDFHSDFSEESILFRWLGDFKLNGLLSDGEVPDISQEPNNIVHVLAKPSKENISPWFRLLLRVSDDKRALLWDIWLDVMSRDPDKTWLNKLAMSAEEEDVLKIIELAKSDGAEVFIKYWNTEDSSGLSASQRWEHMGGEPLVF